MGEHTPQHSSLQQLKRPRRVPAHASAQRDEVLRLLREAKARGQGVSRADLIFQYHYTQCGTRIFELERDGYKIEHRQIPGQCYVTYFLLAEPGEGDWYEQQTGKKRPGWQPRPFSERRLADPNCFVLTPPEPR